MTPSPGHRVSGKAVRGSLTASVRDGGAYGLMVGAGESYLPAFALAAGMSAVATGLVSVIPILAGSIVQVIALALARRAGSIRRWVVGCASLQALSLVLFAAYAGMKWAPAAAVFATASLYWAAGLSAGPPWTAWIGRLVPRTLRISFFSRRSLLVQLMILIGLAATGGVLHAGKEHSLELEAFCAIFLLAAACRFASAGYLARHAEPRGEWRDGHGAGAVPEEIPARIPLKYLPVFAYAFALQAAVHVSGPFVAPYFLDHLKLSYAMFMALSAAVFVAKIAAYPLLERYASRFGVRRLSWLGATLVAPIPALFLLTHSPAGLIAIQALAGVAWGAHELGFFLVVLQEFREAERSRMLMAVNLVNALGMLSGSLWGAALLRHAPGAAGYDTLFAASTALRFPTLALVPFIVRPGLSMAKVFMRVIGLRTNSGSISRPIAYVQDVKESPARRASTD